MAGDGKGSAAYAADWKRVGFSRRVRQTSWKEARLWR